MEHTTRQDKVTMPSLKYHKVPEIQVFENQSLGKIRTLDIDGAIWFVGKDVAEVLGYSRPDHAVTNHVDEEDKLMYQIGTSGQNRNMFIINESGLYSLILSSKLPKSKEFKRWVTSEVLPSIRKTGGYIAEGSEIQKYIEELKESISSTNIKIDNLQQTMSAKIADDKRVRGMAIAKWRKYVATPLISQIVEQTGCETSDAYKIIYTSMAERYGFNESATLSSSDGLCTIDAIASNQLLQVQFYNVARKIINATKSPKQNFATGVSCNDDVEKVIRYIATLMNDTTERYHRARRYIYAQIDSKDGWEVTKKKYRADTKYNLIRMNKKYLDRFVNVCNDIISNPEQLNIWKKQ